MFFECPTHTSVQSRFIFNQDSYLIQTNKPYCSAFTAEPDGLLCRITQVEANDYISGFAATFGGIEGKNAAPFDSFIKKVLVQLEERHARQFVLRQAPFCYDPLFYTSCHTVLLNNGFQLNTAEVNQHILVSPAKEFEAGISDDKRRILRRLKRLGAECRLHKQIENSDWYSLFEKSRHSKGFPLTLSKSAYETLSDKIPDAYTYAGVYLENRLIANAILVRVSAEVLYYFVGASDPEYNALSPSVLIIETMYDLAIREHYTMLDLGISSDGGILNQGLHFFKQHLGAADSAKNTYMFQFYQTLPAIKCIA